MTAHDTIENLWDRAIPIAPLLMTHKAEVTEANAAWLDTVGEPEAAHLLRAIAADLRFAIAHPAASVPPGAPVRASQPSSVSESAQSPTGTPEGALRESGTYPPADDRLRHLLAQRINCHVDTWKLAFFIAGCIADDPEFRAELDRSATAHVAGQPCGDRNCRACFTAATGA